MFFQLGVPVLAGMVRWAFCTLLAVSKDGACQDPVAVVPDLILGAV